ncbi:DUF998 domain-containing protein [Rhodobacteraceae bacterium R_SAG10]|jgi:multisubunit Na+/H+ antiporter MnhB subunit|nr:DUF998 domain-containing protein [Rhodobacteraceae bacterium R_SAG10]
MSNNSSPDPRVMGYLAVRRALGIVGLGLPISLYVYAKLADNMQPSVSAFYYTEMGDIMVGALCAIGIFLIAYKGYPRKKGERLSDRVVATIAGAGAIGVALFPTPYKGDTLCQTGACVNTGIPSHPDWWHYGSAGVFFVCRALFCFFLIPKGARNDDNSVAWTRANLIYFTCGSLIVFSILALLLYWRVSEQTKDVLAGYYYVFWFEALAIAAFAASWLTKGKSLAGLKSLLGNR